MANFPSQSEKVLLRWDEAHQSFMLRLFELHGAGYVERTGLGLPELGLGFQIREGEYQDLRAHWLRWCDRDQTLIETGAERAEREAQRAEQEAQRAEQERRRAERLARKLEQLAIDPNTLPD